MSCLEEYQHTRMVGEEEAAGVEVGVVGGLMGDWQADSCRLHM